MRILFVCTGNTCRSPMAEAITRAAAETAGLPIEVSSAGLHAESVIAPPAVAVLESRGISPGQRVAVQVTAALARENDLTLCATRAHRDALRGQLDDEPDVASRVHVWAEFVEHCATLPEDRDLTEVLSMAPPPTSSEAVDLPDPAGRGDAAYVATAARMDVLAAALLDALVPRLR
ncbi:arsenate reductase/protein-tyrosine-phosphatase family protein [Actinoalloteichus hymeniacidonis]|nr:hypothetical protein [Actinoalloteichus hymeniacidonis]MBB5909738.1 protein-tyrosine-phosphatase [Actinoalloteichus hymeniacidonis]